MQGVPMWLIYIVSTVIMAGIPLLLMLMTYRRLPQEQKDNSPFLQVRISIGWAAFMCACAVFVAIIFKALKWVGGIFGV